MITGSPARRVMGVPLGISRAGTSRATVASFFICISGSSRLGVGTFRLRRDDSRRALGVQGGLQRVPGQSRALHAHGVLAHAREHLELAELRAVGFAGRFGPCLAVLARDELVATGEERLG